MYQDGLKQSSLALDPLAALRAPVTVLQGVSDAVAALLAPLGVSTVLDLATLPLFTLAREIADAADALGDGPLSRLALVPQPYAASSPAPRVDELAKSRLSALRAIDETLAAQLRATLQVETVADLGRWLPFGFARQILAVATLDRAVSGAEPGSELVPRFGEYPTERCFYTTVVIDQVASSTSTELASAGPLDLSPAVSADFGFSAPAVGARLTFGQSWFAHGVTLGNLLHSVALAPGESTRVAVVDWSRRTRSSSSESISERESLTQQASHNRAVSEVQNAVATEAQRGFSHGESESTTSQGGFGIGVAIGPVVLGGSASIGHTTTSADSFSASFGSRSLSASMNQKVMDSTQQAASSVRDRRASLVMEVSEEEHEQVSTRILANYNHMHALTVQYYEVVEIYRVRVELSQAERCLFVPMKLVSFDEATIRRFQGVLAAAALDARARELLSVELGTVRVVPAAATPQIATVPTAVPRALARRVGQDDPSDDEPPPEDPPTGDPLPPDHSRPDRPPEPPFSYDPVEVAQVASSAGISAIRPGSSDLFLPREAGLAALSLAIGDTLVPASAVLVRQNDGQAPVALSQNGFEWVAPAPILLQEISEVLVTTTAQTPQASGRAVLQLSYRGSLFPVTLPVQLRASTTACLCRMQDLTIGAELHRHLLANRLHYSQAIWRSLDGSTLTLLLSRFSFEGRPVADLIDPHPVMVAGNYLVFRMPAFIETADSPAADADGPLAASHAAWRTWLRERGLRFGASSSDEQLVPIPTGGVFAEAVLGRSNSAEKLDATRFWNWQDSPIPLAPPEIAAISLASRAQPVDARPGQLGQPVLNLINPTSLPDPTGVGAALGAIQNGSMFRDMSGLAATIGLAQATAANATSGAASAGQLANANVAIASQHDIEQKKIAAQLAMAALANPAAAAGTPKTSSETGALLNTAEELDKSGVKPGAGQASEAPLSSAAMSRAVFGAAGESASSMVADIIPIKDGPGSGSGSGGAVVAKEVYFYATALNDAYPNVAAEVKAMVDETWLPTTRDFDAICFRSAGNVATASDARIEDFMQFLAKLALPASRYNFFVYGSSIKGDMIHFDGSVDPEATGGFGGVIPDKSIRPHAIDAQTLAALLELRSLSSQRELRSALGRVYGAGRDRPNRELWWYQVGERASVDLLKTLSSFIDMPIRYFDTPVFFIPDFQPNPPEIQVRGQLGLGLSRSEAMATRTKNIHTLDARALRVTP